MFRNVLAATLANLARNRLYAAISIASLAIAMAAAMLTGLYIRDETAFDGGIPGVEKVYVVVSDYRLGTSKPKIVDNTVVPIGPQLKLDIKDVLDTARVMQSSLGVRHGEVAAIESGGWTDPELFSFLRAPTVAGDAAAALRQADGAVITRAMARKYFGQDAPIGQTLELNGASLFRVLAVLEDPPANTNLAQAIFLSNLSALSPIHLNEANFKPRESYNSCCRTYVAVADAAAARRVEAALPDFFARRIGFPGGRLKSGAVVSLHLVPLTRLHLYPLNGFSTFGEGVPQGSWSIVWALALTAAVVLAVGAVNFVNLMTARAARRAVEVGVRKTAGARQADLMLQFIGEAVLYALIALVFAVAMVELLLPAARALLARPMALSYWRDPLPLAGALVLALLLGVLAGVYPAFIQSSFRPAAVLKGVSPQASGSALVRAGLTTLQFASLIVLILAAAVIARQTHFTLNEGLNLDTAQTMTMNLFQPRKPGVVVTTAPTPPCRGAFPDQVRRLPGVAGAACSDPTVLDIGDAGTTLPRPNGESLSVLRSQVDFGFFELYGLKPVAGRFFSRSHPADEALQDGPSAHMPKLVVINQMMVRALGFASDQEAIGRSFKANIRPDSPIDLEIIGVAPDFAFDLFDLGKRPRFYAVDPSSMYRLHIKLTGRDVAATVGAIDTLWKQGAPVLPPSHRFVDDYLQSFYLATIQQGYMLDALCAVAVFLASLGLFGLAAFTAERRTKEIGVRKALGASSPDVVRLLLWSFTRPVLWANLIAWPLAWWALSRWLDGFVRHIPLQPWLFIAAAMAALMIAWSTVLAHTLKVARAKPVGALRYE